MSKKIISLICLVIILIIFGGYKISKINGKNGVIVTNSRNLDSTTTINAVTKEINQTDTTK
ncbi:hypothetical protein [uncultured Clostridium sp.]|uniref:hypothetical protein n=1 Tax=uncultured Clostridium sp. TaxID=59620 RepID=UPI002603584B|nr:hypothetical protein [uncultured Clostridium sp.]